MSETVIRAEGLGKRYLIGHQQRAPYVALRDVLADGVRQWWARLRNPQFGSGDTLEEFWALRDVDFEVKQGERIGIIGRNGAGKSTLLKILSRIVEPTTGKATIRGRVVSLLEVGTGFHPELTGRENIFLNGAILGMGRQETRRKFDEIVAFAEVEKFLDTPVKRYSSGMYVRLAFAVAAHLEPEILIVDEVLAVGDAQFQKKCLGKMAEVGREGRTVLFVSHNMQAIRQFCNRAMLLQAGRVAADAGTSGVITRYLQDHRWREEGECLEDIIKNLPADQAFRLDGVRLTQEGQVIASRVESGKPLEVELSYSVLERIKGLRVYFDLCDAQDTLLFRSFHDEDNDGIPVVEPGCYVSRASIPANLLGPLRYELRVGAGIFNVRNCLPPMAVRLPLDIVLTGKYNRAYLGDTFRGKFALALCWATARKEQAC
ncbi:ABC transporter ATP-binding protein [Thiovibrio sp. JS02]